MVGFVALNLAALGVLLAYTIWLAFPPSEAARLRNALLLRREDEVDFSWTPDTVPADFRKERLPASTDYMAIVQSLGVGEMQLRLGQGANAGRAPRHARGRQGSHPIGPVHDLPADAAGLRLLRRFREGLPGPRARSRSVRAPMGILPSMDFGGHGHTFVEVFDRQRARWIFVDVFNNFHAIDTASGGVLSAQDFRDFATGKRDGVAMRANGPGRPGFIHEAKALDYYRRGAPEWYMWWGNAVFSFYAHPLVRAAGRVSRSVAHVIAIVIGLHPKMQIYPLTENREHARRMLELRRRLYWIGAILLALVASLGAQLALADAARG